MFLTIGLLDLGAAAFWCVFASGDGIDDKVLAAKGCDSPRTVTEDPESTTVVSPAVGKAEKSARSYNKRLVAKSLRSSLRSSANRTAAPSTGRGAKRHGTTLGAGRAAAGLRAWRRWPSARRSTPR